jgi:hypothetical protein
MGAGNAIRQDGLTTFRKPLLRSEVGPALLLQFRQVNDTWNDNRLGYNGDRLPFFFLHVSLVLLHAEN